MDAKTYQLIQDLVKCDYAPATFEKRFVRDMAAKSPVEVLTEKQLMCLGQIAYRWRKQLEGNAKTLRGEAIKQGTRSKELADRLEWFSLLKDQIYSVPNIRHDFSLSVRDAIAKGKPSVEYGGFVFDLVDAWDLVTSIADADPGKPWTHDIIGAGYVEAKPNPIVNQFISAMNAR